MFNFIHIKAKMGGGEGVGALYMFMSMQGTISEGEASTMLHLSLKCPLILRI
jgi:hypothetical protein